MQLIKTISISTKKGIEKSVEKIEEKLDLIDLLCNGDIGTYRIHSLIIESLGEESLILDEIVTASNYRKVFLKIAKSFKRTDMKVSIYKTNFKDEVFIKVESLGKLIEQIDEILEADFYQDETETILEFKDGITLTIRNEDE